MVNQHFFGGIIELRNTFTKALSAYKRIGYSIFIALFLSSLYLIYYIAYQYLNWPESIAVWFLPFAVFVLIPLADTIIGEDQSNIPEHEEPLHDKDTYYRWVTFAVLPAYALVLVWGLWILRQWELSWALQLGWIVSVGTIGGAVGITTAHELVHKPTKHEQTIGGLILSLVCYSGFKIEHVYGHHVNVSTPKDASSSRYNQSLYHFLPLAYYKNISNAWHIQKKRMQKKELPFFSFKNELINYQLVSLLVLVIFTLWQGWLGAVYFLGTSFVAFTLLEIVNYIEHYGLHRVQLDNGRYERVRPEHSWNSNHLVTNLFLFHLQRHSDHHANPKRRYQILRNYDNIPQLPSGYATMIVVALFPPLWKKIMNPRVESYYQGRQHVLDS